MTADARNIGLCMLLPVAALAVARPWAEGGCIDDFSYIHMAKTLAETGRFAYNGWPTATLGAQIWWGAAWVRLFGFSFTLVRLGVLPLALGSSAIVYLLARRARLSASDSLFAALLTSLSTLFLPLVPTFMSDLPAFFFLVACQLAFVLAAEAVDHDPRGIWRPIGWLAAGTCLGVVGGTIRQPVWFVPVACTAALSARRSGAGVVRAATAAAGLVGLAAMVVGTWWFSRQPYAVPTAFPALADLATAEAVRGIVVTAATVAAEICQKLLPAVLFCLPWVWETLRAAASEPRIRRALPAAAAVLGLAMAAVLAGTVSRRMEMPLALLGGWWRPTGEPLHDVGVGLIRCGVLALLVAAGAAVAARRRNRGGAARGSLPPAIVLPLVSLVPYVLALLLVSRTTAGVYPRYYLPVLPAVAVWLLHGTRPVAGGPGARVVGRSTLGWLLVAFFAARGVAIVHDEFADTRMRLAAIAFLEGRGVERHRIASKWVIDGWVQIERDGHMNDSRIRVPTDAYDPVVPRPYPDEKFRDKLPAIEADYVVADSREEFSGDTAAFPRFPFVAWWKPPFRREIVIHGPAPGGATDPARAP